MASGCTPPPYYQSCPPPSPDPCAPVCPPPPPPPTCRTKPIMRGLHWTQTKGIIRNMMIICTVAGTCFYYFVGCKRRQAYHEYYAKANMEDQAAEMAKKGLFQAVPKTSFHME